MPRGRRPRERGQLRFSPQPPARNRWRTKESELPRRGTSRALASLQMSEARAAALCPYPCVTIRLRRVLLRRNWRHETWDLRLPISDCRLPELIEDHAKQSTIGNRKSNVVVAVVHSFRRDVRLFDRPSFRALEPTHVRYGGSVTAHGNQFGGDGHGNLFGSDGTDVQSNRRVHSVEQVRRQSLLLQRFEDLDHLALGSDHADVAGRGLHRPAQDPHVVAMAAGDNDDVRRLSWVQLACGFIEVEGVNFVGVWKSFLGRVGTAIVSHDEVETGIRSYPAKIDSYVTCTEKIK